MKKSSSSRAPRKALAKPKKPYPGFPLTPHASGKWMKKINGKIYYFGTWARREGGKLVRIEGDGAKEAEAAFNAERDNIHAGRERRASRDGLTVKDLCNHFLTAKLRKVEAGELTKRLFMEYREVTDLLVKQFGGPYMVEDLAAGDFAALRATMAKKWGPVRLGNTITRTKSVFKFGYESGLMDRPARYGPEFVKPDKAVLRKHRAKSAPKMFEAAELRALIDGAERERDGATVKVTPDPVLRAMILLGANCGFGNTDCSSLALAAVDLAGGWVNFPRPKTGIARRCPLWPETVAALRAVIATRPKPADAADADLVFLTVRGTPFVTHSDGGMRKDVIGIQFGKLLGALDMHRRGVGFYALRHVFETVGSAAKDQNAVDLIMGHTDPSMAAVYRERISDDRLTAVAEYVRKWVFVLHVEPAKEEPAAK